MTTRSWPLAPVPSRRDDQVTVLFAALAVVLSLLAFAAGMWAWVQWLRGGVM